MKKITISILCLLSLALIHCKKEDPFADEHAKLQTWLSDNNITTAPTASGLYYIETLAGTGEQAVSGKKVFVHYSGYLLDGTLFDTSLDGSPLAFTLGIGKVIKGWEEGIKLMKEGGKARLIIPSNLAYGSQGAGNGAIPPYSTLIFDVELVSVQ